MATSFRLYESTELGAHNNLFISSLFISIRALTEAQDLTLNASARIEKVEACLKHAENAVATVLDVVSVGLSAYPTRDEINRLFECKLWLKHEAWTCGSFALARKVIVSICGPESEKAAAVVGTIKVIHDSIKAIKLTTTTHINTPSESVVFEGAYKDLVRTAVAIKSNLANNPGSNRRPALMSNLAAYLLRVLGGVLECAALQERFSQKEEFAVLAGAMCTLQEHVSEDCQIDHHEQLNKMWATVSSLSDSSELCQSIANRVSASVKLCEAYSHRTILQKIREWCKFQLSELERKFQAARDEVLPNPWVQGGGAAAATIFWLLVAPALAIADGVNYLRGKEASNYFNRYNDFISLNWRENTWITLGCCVGLAGGLATSALTGVGAISWAPVLIHLLTATGVGVGIGITAISFNCIANGKLARLTDQEIAERRKLLTLKDIRLNQAESEKVAVDHEATVEKMHRLGKKISKMMDDDEEDEKPSKPPATPTPAPAPTSAPTPPSSPPAAAPSKPSSQQPKPQSEFEAARSEIHSCWANMTKNDNKEAQKQFRKKDEAYAANLKELDDQQTRAIAREAEHTKLLGSIDWTQRLEPKNHSQPEDDDRSPSSSP